MALRTTSFAHGQLDKDDESVPIIMNENMRRLRTCKHCHQTYYEYENIGAWRCMMHTHPFDQDRKVYPCCNTTGKGCQGADHYEDETVRYPGCRTDADPFRGVPVFQLCEGNLKELRGVWAEAIQRLRDYPEQKRALGDSVVVFVYRQCLFGRPAETHYGH